MALCYAARCAALPLEFQSASRTTDRTYALWAFKASWGAAVARSCTSIAAALYASMQRSSKGQLDGRAPKSSGRRSFQKLKRSRGWGNLLNLDSIDPTVLGWLAGLCVLGLVRYWLNRRK
jgi:hypothetical protein